MEMKLLRKDEFIELVPEIDDLHEKSFGISRGKKYYNWKFVDNPYGESIIVGVFSGKKIVSFYAITPTDILINGVKTRAALSLNTMTDPDFSGRGLFTNAAKFAYKIAENDYKCKFIYGFTNGISNRIFSEQLGWNTVYEVPMLQKELLLEKLDVEHSVIVDNEFRFNYSQVLSLDKSGISVFKDQSYLMWRYIKSPESQYVNIVVLDEDIVCAFAICKFFDNRVNVVEWHSISNAYQDKLFKEVFRFALQNGKSVVTTWSRMDTSKHLLLEKLGFMNRYPIQYFGLKILGNFEHEVDVKDYRNWNLQLGDNNTY